MKEYKNSVGDIWVSILGEPWADVPVTDYNTIASMAVESLNYQDLITIDSHGARYSWDNIETAPFNLPVSQPDEVIMNVASLFATAFPEGIVGQYSLWGSYGMKHDLENVMKKVGKIPYVSNGYGILGYIHYLVNVLGIDKRNLNKYVRKPFGLGHAKFELNFNSIS